MTPANQTRSISINLVTYNFVKLVTNILSPLVGKSLHHTQNSLDFVNRMHSLKLEKDGTMVTFDVTFLFTWIPTKEAVEAVNLGQLVS